MTFDTFIYQMHRFEQEVQDHPDLLALVAAQEAFLTRVQTLDRGLVKMNKALKKL